MNIYCEICKKKKSPLKIKLNLFNKGQWEECILYTFLYFQKILEFLLIIG